MRVDWSPSAIADLKTIAEWIEQDRDLETANRIVRAIYDAVQGLRIMPYRGRYGRLENTRELSLHGFPTLSFIRFSRNVWSSSTSCTAPNDGREPLRSLAPGGAGGFGSLQETGAPLGFKSANRECRPERSHGILPAWPGLNARSHSAALMHARHALREIVRWKRGIHR